MDELFQVLGAESRTIDHVLIQIMEVYKLPVYIHDHSDPLAVPQQFQPVVRVIGEQREVLFQGLGVFQQGVKVLNAAAAFLDRKSVV